MKFFAKKKIIKYKALQYFKFKHKLAKNNLKKPLNSIFDTFICVMSFQG